MALPAALAATAGPHGPAILGILIATYAGIAVGRVPGLKLDRTGIALLGAIAVMIFGGGSAADVAAYVNWPTLLLLFGFFVIAAQLQLSGFYDRVAGAISRRLDHPARFLLVLMLVTAALSAFLNHDVVCLVFTPIVGAALLRQRLNPVPFLIGLAIASNLGAAATPVGNPQDMLIAQVALLPFGRYLLWAFAPVAFALFAAYGLIWWLSRGTLARPASGSAVEPAPSQPYDRAHTVKGLVILGVVIVLFFLDLPKEVIALAAAGFHLASPKFRTEDLLRLVDWPILVLFMSLFVITGAFSASGYGDQLMAHLGAAGFDLHRPATLAATTAVLSNLINNAAAVMLLLKVVDVHAPVTAYTLALANSFGGSLLIIGSVSNLIVVQQARRLGVTIGFRDFARLGVPVTLTALLALVGWCAVAG